MTSDEIRSSFIDYFRKRSHTVVPSAPLIPADDPTLLFTNAGMNQFKDVFLGIGNRDYKRAVDTQKCMRVSGKHNDLEEVGYSKSHHTFFEMLGNWSFGDYYKRDAIAFAWELVTEVWKMPKEKLWASVHLDDDESENLWCEVTDINPRHVQRFDDKDNFWQMADTGPCGPNSELHIDLGPEACPTPDKEHTCAVNACDRYREFWNLVFIQYNRDDTGTLHPLPETHVDTGMGFERAVAILQGVDSNYKTDVFTPLIDSIANLTDREYSDDDGGVPHRVIADHSRCLTFAIGDGVMPSNEGRGYVIRRLLRRAVLYGKRLGINQPFVYQVVDKVVDLLGNTFPDVRPRKDFVKRIVEGEERRFHQTLDRGLDLLDASLESLKSSNESVLAGARAFELYDTFGFPLDLTRILTSERGVSIDEQGFKESMSRQRERSRAHWKAAGGAGKGQEIYAEVLSESGKTEFLGYEDHSAEAEIVALIQANNLVSGVVEGDKVSVILNRTPFYGESGGQIGDVGTIQGRQATLEVVATSKPVPDLFLHECKVIEGEITAAATVKAKIDADRRGHIAVSHTATHILHGALRNTLGGHVGQAGSLVEPGRLRFDFTHFEAVSPDLLYDIEAYINEKIRLNDSIEIDFMPLQQAKDRGALAFFGDKYGEIVRLVQIGDYSKELCGGTHVNATGEIGLVKLVNESSIAAGVRRIEALTGAKAYQNVCAQDDTLSRLADLLKTPTHHLTKRVEALLQENRLLEGQLEALKGKLAKSRVADLAQGATVVNGFKVVASAVENADRNGLRHLVDELKEQISSGVVVLAATDGDEATFVAGVTSNLAKDTGLHAGKIIQDVVRIAGGRGGGRSDLAQGGCKDPSKVKDAIDEVVKIVANQA
jgi:alanyl-tRNA synthetase